MFYSILDHHQIMREMGKTTKKQVSDKAFYKYIRKKFINCQL